MDYLVYSTVAYPLKRDGTHDWNSVNELDHETKRGVPTKTGKEQANTYQVSFLETLSAKVCHPNNQFSMTVCIWPPTTSHQPPSHTHKPQTTIAMWLWL